MSKAPVNPFDFETLYLRYPRRGEGKTKGMLKLKKSITSEEQFRRFETALNNYITLIEVSRRERQYIKMWSTFCNNWEDYESAEDLGLEVKHSVGLRVVT